MTWSGYLSRARAFWKTYWIAVRRSGKDKRARSFVLKVTFASAYLAAYIGYICFTVLLAPSGQGAWMAIFYGFIFGTAAVAAFLLRRSHRKQDELLNYSLTGRTPLHERDARVAPDVRAYLEERAFILASMLARGGSEIYLRNNQLPPGMSVLTRQTQNGLLRQRGLWGKLEQAEADLAMAPDGNWTEEQHNLVLAWCEQLRLLRWVLGVDAALTPLAHFPSLDFSLPRDLLSREAGGDKPTLNSWDVREERDIAAGYTTRVVAELKARCLLDESEDVGSWADEFRSKSLGPSSDYLAGTKTIGELDDNALRLLGSFAAARERYASYLTEQLSAAEPIPFSRWLIAASSTAKA